MISEWRASVDKAYSANQRRDRNQLIDQPGHAQRYEHCSMEDGITSLADATQSSMKLKKANSARNAASTKTRQQRSHG